MTSLRELLEGKYEILGQLDDAGAGEVYKVRHLFLDEVRLVRVVRPEGAPGREASARQLDEARAAMRLRHPHLAQLHDFSLDDEGNAFIVLESIEGLPLDAALRELGPPPVGLALEIAQQALRALGYLHRGGMVVHHVAPERLVLTRDVDGRPLVKWTDLGISRLPGASGREPDARSDLYSFGLLLCEMLTGRSMPPLDFAASDPRGRLPAELREAVLQTLAKDPAQRPASAEELARRLVTIQDQFPEQGDYLERALGKARERAAALRPVVLPPKPAPVPDLPLRGAEATRQLEWDRPRAEYGTQRVPAQPAAPAPVRPMAPPVTPPPAPVSPEQPAGSRLRWVLVIAGIAVVAALGGAIGAFLGRGNNAARPARSAPAGTEPAAPTPAPVAAAPQVVEVDPKPEPPPPPENEKAEPSRLSRREEQARREEQTRREEERRRREALRPPSQVPEGAVIKAPAGPMQRGDLITPGPGVTGVEYPEPATEIAASYPPGAVASRRSAKVRVAVLVDENGNVVQTRIREGDPSGLGFNESAMAAARRVRFLPATRDGVPGKFWTDLIYEFEPPAVAEPPAPPVQGPSPPALLLVGVVFF